MGKGDKRSKRGKITIGSYGKTRPHKVKTAASPVVATVVKPAPVAKAPKVAAPKAEKKKKA